MLNIRWFGLAMLNYQFTSLSGATMLHLLSTILLVVEAVACLVHDIPRRAIHHVKVRGVLLVLLHDADIRALLCALAIRTVSMGVSGSWRAHAVGDVVSILEGVPVHCKHV